MYYGKRYGRLIALVGPGQCAHSKLSQPAAATPKPPAPQPEGHLALKYQ